MSVQEPVLRIENTNFNGHKWGASTVHLGHYESQTGPWAIFLTEEDSGESLATVTVNLVLTPTTPGAVWVKNWSENEGILELFESLGWLERTGETQPTGWVEAIEAKPTGDLAELFTKYAEAERLRG